MTLVLLGFSSGVVISGAVFAFITTLGIVNYLAKKTKTEQYIKVYEEIIICGGVFGASTNIIKYYLPLGDWLVIILSLGIGVFYGCFAMALAEVLNVIPILMRRLRISYGLSYMITAMAMGKMIGSLLYYCVSGFHVSK